MAFIQFAVYYISIFHKMFFSWRIENPNLSTFNKTQRNQIQSFQNFISQKPDGFCCVCLELLYPENQKYRLFINEDYVYCLKWKLTPLCMANDPNMKMVCKAHLKSDLANFKPFEYPGKLCCWIIIRMDSNWRRCN